MDKNGLKKLVKSTIYMIVGI